MFPYIEHINDVLPSIEGSPEFNVSVKGPYTIINYNVVFGDTFPDLVDHHAAIRRECRGITFDTKTGDLIRRPLEKFFNYGERKETSETRVNLSEPHVILEKLDGSMICPTLIDGNLVWGTKMCAPDFHDMIDEFVFGHPEYYSLSLKLIDRGYNPIFEWCSRKSRIVIDHPEDQLVLLAVRRINSGEYMPYNVMVGMAKDFGIPVVKAFDFQDIDDVRSFSLYTKDLKDTEGFVVRFDSGKALKLKCDWYVQIHKAKERLLQDRHVIEALFNNDLDDIRPHLLSEDLIKLDSFVDNIKDSVKLRVARLFGLISGYTSVYTRKEFALYRANEVDRYEKPIIFKFWDGCTEMEVYDAVIATIMNNISNNTKYNELRDTWFEGFTYNED